MTANPILLQKKYARIIERFSEKENLSLDDALSFFYRSTVYQLISEGVSDLHLYWSSFFATLCSKKYLTKSNFHWC